ncbi:hypothetical protein [Pedobacter antarcticus]|uniref:hypothetical protein n=1 Tax=Pedobacter antarcticus TaxID=34086 RepID=UPI00292F6F09|nr:hypothetical protein [Pedobacter antarcticus]
MSARIFMPLQAHVKRYLTIQFGKELYLSELGVVPFLLYNMLEKHKKGDPSKIKPSQKLIDNKKYFGYPVFIGDKIERTRGLYLSNEKLKIFNDAVDNLIRDEMYRWCNHPGSIDGKVDFDIVRFRDMYGITEDELPFDNLKRWYYRERERLAHRKNEVITEEPQLTLFY